MGVFLTSGSTPIDLRSKHLFELHHDALFIISEGVILWENVGSEAVLKFRKYVESKFVIVVTDTQLVNRWVKDSHRCTHIGKDDHITSMIAICRSATVLDYKHMVKQAAKDRILHGNQHLAADKIRTWADKAGQREASKDIVDVLGSPYNTLVILQTISWSDQLRAVRTDKTVETYTHVVFTTALKPLNSIQKQRGFDVTNHMKG